MSAQDLIEEYRRDMEAARLLVAGAREGLRSILGSARMDKLDVDQRLLRVDRALEFAEERLD